jgi:hypothetical protein
MQRQANITGTAPAPSDDGRIASRRLLDGQRLMTLFALGLLLLNFPLLALWDVHATVLGVPAFPAALFMLWALLIAAAGWMVERMKD